MARPPRIEFPGAFYHIIVRGNQRQDIFLDDQDRSEYLTRIQRYRKERGFILYAYVLMTNHVHLLIETPLTPISRIMQLISLTYTQYFNRKYNKVGHLFQGRYKSLLCDRDEYLLSLVRYIHLNPVRADVVKGPGEYGWSSHNDYLRGKSDIVQPDRVLRLFSERVSRARKLYEEFVNEAIGTGRDEELYSAVGQQIVGDDTFVETVEKKVDGHGGSYRRPPLVKILRAVEETTGVSGDKMISLSRGKEAVFARSLLAVAAREYGYRLADLQTVLKRDYSVLSKLSRAAVEEGKRERMKETLKILNAHLQT